MALMCKRWYSITIDSPILNRIGVGPRLAAVSLDSAFAWVGGGLTALFCKNVFRESLQKKVQEIGGREVADLGIGMVEFYSLLIAILAGVLCFSLLSGILEAFTGASVGKRFMKIRIRSEHDTQADWSKLLLRAVLKHVSFVFFLITLLTGIQLYTILGGFMGMVTGMGMVLILGETRQTLHDRIAETAVYPIKKPARSSRPGRMQD